MTKVKVALCFSGAIGIVEGPMLAVNSIYRSRNYIDYKKCYNSTKKFIIEPNQEKYEIDTFCHCWTPTLEKEIVELYSPKKSVFEDNVQYNILISELCNQAGDFSGISKALSMKKSIELKEAYEAEHNITYDITIVYRYDILLWKQLVLDTYINLDQTMYVSAGANRNGEMHFVMSNTVARDFKNLIDSIKLGNKYRVHSWIQTYVVAFMKLKIKDDSIFAGVHQEVFRKVGEYSIGRGHLTMEQFKTLF